jgi:hypothetical protein
MKKYLKRYFVLFLPLIAFYARPYCGVGAVEICTIRHPLIEFHREWFRYFADLIIFPTNSNSLTLIQQLIFSSVLHININEIIILAIMTFILISIMIIYEKQYNKYINSNLKKLLLLFVICSILIFNNFFILSTIGRYCSREGLSCPEYYYIRESF